MENVFDSENYPDSVPDALTSGSRWAWTRSDITAAYPTALYTLVFRLSLMESPYSDYSITSSKVSSAHVVEVSQATTAGYVNGEYSWSAVVIRDSDSEEVTVDRGFTTVEPDLGASPGDTRSWVYRVLVAVRATIEGTASREMASYTVGGRALSARTPTELLELEREFSRRWRDEKRDIDRKAGRSAGSRVLVGMSA